MKRIEGCQHTLERMHEWCEEAACPICLTATCGMLRDELAALRADYAAKVAQAVREIDEHSIANLINKFSAIEIIRLIFESPAKGRE